jgi:hypothetical protein
MHGKSILRVSTASLEIPPGSDGKTDRSREQEGAAAVAVDQGQTLLELAGCPIMI